MAGGRDHDCYTCSPRNKESNCRSDATGGLASEGSGSPDPCLESGFDVPPIWYAGLYAIFTVPAGLGIGALIDWALPHDEMHVEYRRSGSPSVSIGVSPLLDKKARGLSLSLRF